MCASSPRLLLPFTVLAFVALNSALADEPAADAPARQRIEAALSKWEAASRDVQPPTDEDEHVAYAVHKSTSSGHEIAVALEFQGPVRSKDLMKKYRWTRIEETGNAVHLHGESLEEVERLFYSGFEVELDGVTNLPVAIRFVDRNGKQKVQSLALAVKTQRSAGERSVQLIPGEWDSSTFRLLSVEKQAEHLQQEPGKPVKPTEISPDLEAVLKNWEAAAAKQQTVDAEFTRRIYDSTYQTETVSHGRLYLDRPDKGSLEFIGITPGSTESARKDPATGKQYSLVADSSETWVLTESHLLHLNPDMKVADKIELPVDDNPREIAPRGGWYFVLAPRGIRNFCNDALSLFGVGRVDDLRTNYHLTLIKRQVGNVFVQGKPANERVEAIVKEFTIIIDDSTWLPQASRFTDPSGNLETVYVFSNWKVNQPLDPSDRPLDPDLTGYKIHRQELAKNGPPACPSLIGLTAKDAAGVLKKCNYEVVWQRGEPAKNDKLVYIVYEQTPDPTTPLPKGEKVILKVYDKIPPTVQKN